MLLILVGVKHMLKVDTQLLSIESELVTSMVQAT